MGSRTIGMTTRSGILGAKTGLKLAAALLIGAAILAFGGFVLAPAIIDQRVTAALAVHTGQPVTIRRVSVNPLSRTVRFNDLAVGDPGSIPYARVAQIVVRYRTRGIFGEAWHADEVTVTAPQLTVTAGAGQALVAALSSATHLAIGRMTVTAGSLTVALKGNAPLRIGDIKLSLTDLDTTARQPGIFSLTGAALGGGTVSVAGSVMLSPAMLEAKINVTDLDVGQLRTPLPASPEFELSAAAFAGNARMRLVGNGLSLVGEVKLDRVALLRSATGATVFTADSVTGRSVTVTTAPFAMSAGWMRLDGPHVRMSRGPDGTLNGGSWLARLVQGTGDFFPHTERVEIVRGRLDFTDLTRTPAVQIGASDIHGSIVQYTGDSMVALSLDGQLASAGSARVAANWMPGTPSRNNNWHVAVNDLQAPLLSPYLVRTTGHEFAAGTLSLSVDGGANEGAIQIRDEIHATGLKLLAHEQMSVAADWPLSLAIALLEDPAGEIRVAVPVPAGSFQPGQSVSRRLLDALRGYLANLVKAPFAALGLPADGAQTDSAQVTFSAGSAALGEAQSDRLHSLATALLQRPRIGLKIAGRYDPAADRNALARQQMRLHVALATSAGLPARTKQAPLNFSDPRVISVLEEFAGERLRAVAVTSIRARFAQIGPEYYAALFEALLDNETVSRRALNNLARFRAQAVIGELTAANIAPERLAVANSVEPADARDGMVWLPLGIRVLPPGQRSQRDGKESAETLVE